MENAFRKDEKFLELEAKAVKLSQELDTVLEEVNQKFGYKDWVWCLTAAKTLGLFRYSYPNDD